MAKSNTSNISIRMDSNLKAAAEELYEELGFHKKKKYINCLKNIDVLVDGRFEKDKKDLTLPFRGSSNQRVIDVKQTLSTHTLTLYQPN